MYEIMQYQGVNLCPDGNEQNGYRRGKKTPPHTIPKTTAEKICWGNLLFPHTMKSTAQVNVQKFDKIHSYIPSN